MYVVINLFFTLTVISGILYLSIIYGSTATALSGLAIAAFAVLSYIYLILAARHVSCTVEAPVAIAVPGEEVNIIVKNTTSGIFSMGRTKYYLRIQNEIGNGRKKIRCREDGIYNMSFPEAGQFQIVVKYIKKYDPSGLLCVKKKMKKSCKVMVLPEVIPILVDLTEGTKNFIGDADVYDDVRPGHDPSERFGVRPFADGDKIQSVHWKLSAKSDELMVNENSLPKACSAVILIERCAKDMAEYLKVIASYSFSIMDIKCPHYVAWYSGIKNDIMRIRVDDEESYYIMLNYLLAEKKMKKESDIVNAYNEKYKSENILHRLYLDRDMVMYNNGNKIGVYTKGSISKQLEDTEILL